MQTIDATGTLADFCDRAGKSCIDTARAALRLLLHWHERARQRRVLAELDDRLLRDIGVTHDQAARERAKPFWR